ncbi:hypothetical protein Pcinc_023322 [Petrolisthes cinctipes]|uniref:Uncharacterized protein n=1 Tax=Petrolisthes cinctipes TaxID=88211 RepID=A0AAE1KCC7_PETCI|nr:hypothetical protein Pcinc_023322 [Petrolisthes cinctipes]
MCEEQARRQQAGRQYSMLATSTPSLPLSLAWYSPSLPPSVAGTLPPRLALTFPSLDRFLLRPLTDSLVQSPSLFPPPSLNHSKACLSPRLAIYSCPPSLPLPSIAWSATPVPPILYSLSPYTFHSCKQTDWRADTGTSTLTDSPTPVPSSLTPSPLLTLFSLPASSMQLFPSVPYLPMPSWPLLFLYLSL